MKEAFSVLFSIACFKEASVADHMLFLNDTCQRNVTFIRSVHVGRWSWSLHSSTSCIL
jgi:hypothetical protein